jgi:IS5 family transposase
MRTFAGIDLGLESALDETTVCKSRHLVETHALRARRFEQIGAHLQRRGLTINTGTFAAVPHDRHSILAEEPRSRNAILRCTRRKKGPR